MVNLPHVTQNKLGANVCKVVALGVVSSKAGVRKGPDES